MTLLCGFFIMLFSMSTLDKPKFEKVRQEVSEHFQGQYENPNQKLGDFVTQIVRDAGVEKEATVRTTPRVSPLHFTPRFFSTLSVQI